MVYGVTGILELVGSSPIDLSGSFALPSGPFAITGGGYTFTGMVTGGALSRTWTGPGASGSFATLISNGCGPVTVDCGSFGGTSSGTRNLAVGASTVMGSYSETNGGSGVLTGSISG